MEAVLPFSVSSERLRSAVGIPNLPKKASRSGYGRCGFPRRVSPPVREAIDNVRQDSQLNHLAITPTEINMEMIMRGYGGNIRGRAFARAKAYALTSLPGLFVCRILFERNVLPFFSNDTPSVHVSEFVGIGSTYFDELLQYHPHRYASVSVACFALYEAEGFNHTYFL